MEFIGEINITNNTQINYNQERIWFNRYEKNWKQIHPEYSMNDRPFLSSQFDNNKEEIIKELTIIKTQKTIKEREIAHKKYFLNKEKHQEYHKKRWAIVKDEVLLNKKERRINDPMFAVTDLVRTRIWAALHLQGVKRSLSYEKLLGCSIPVFMKHIESKFLPGMNWQNRGFGGWTFDHIIPCASFDLIDIDNQKKCFHYTNVQPLWHRDNCSKEARFRLVLPKPSNELAMALKEIDDLKKEIKKLKEGMVV